MQFSGTLVSVATVFPLCRGVLRPVEVTGFAVEHAPCRAPASGVVVHRCRSLGADGRLARVMDPAPRASPGHLDRANEARHVAFEQTLTVARRSTRVLGTGHAASSASEQVLWQALRGQRQGVGFRRQVRLGSYIVDFLAPSVRLIIEVDGGYHQGRRNADARRDRWLRRQGYTVLRLQAATVLEDLNGALQAIRTRL